MATTAWLSPGTVTEDTSVGNRTFTNPGNVANTGAPYATINWATGIITSSRIKATNFNFSGEGIGSSDTIQGISFRYNRVEVSVTDNINTIEIYIIDSSGALITTTNNADTAEWPTVMATSTVGGASDLMGYTGATGADIISSNFGISFRAGTIGSGTTPDGSLGVFQVQITYTASAGGVYVPRAMFY